MLKLSSRTKRQHVGYCEGAGTCRCLDTFASIYPFYLVYTLGFAVNLQWILQKKSREIAEVKDLGSRQDIEKSI